MSKVLLVISEEAHARELSRVAEHLQKTSDLKPVFFVEDRMKPFGMHTLLGASGVETLTSDDIKIGPGASKFQGRGLLRRLTSGVLTLSRAAIARLPRSISRRFGPLFQIAGERDRVLQRFGLCDAVLSYGYAAVLICEDNIDLETPNWTEAAHRHRICCLIVPYTVANTVELTEAYVFVESLQLRASPVNRVAAWLFPKWATRHKGRNFLRANYGKIAATELLGLAPPNPWLLNSGYADAIAVESLAMRDYYSAAGIPARQLVLTGTLVDDAMAKVIADASNRRRALLEEAGLPLDRPVLLCAFPPDQAVFDRPGCEFQSFDDMIEFWGKSLGAVKGWNILVARHPKTRAGRLDALRQHGLTLIDHDTASVVPLCDLYLASVSATIRWAIACGKPVMNYDSYRLDFQDYPGVEAVVLVKKRQEFLDLLAAMTGDPAYFSRMQAAQQREAPRWGFHDGQSGHRLLSLIRGETVAEPLALRPASGQN